MSFKSQIEEAREIVADYDRQRGLLPKAHMGDPRYATKMETRAMNLTDADKAFLGYLRGTVSIETMESKALVEDTGLGGGAVLISPEIDRIIQTELAKLVVIRSLAGKRTITSDRILTRDIGKAAVAWGKLSLGTEIEESTPTPGDAKYTYAESLYGLVKLSETLLADSDFDLAQIIASSFADVIAEAEEIGYIRGGGHTVEAPSGIAVDTTLLAQATEITTGGSPIFEDIYDLVYSVPARVRKGASFVMHSTLELALRKIRSKTGESEEGNFLWSPGLVAGAPNRLIGYPCYVCDELDPLDGSEGVIAIFGDFGRGYRIVDRMGMSLKVLDQIYLESGLIGYRIHKRTGGAIVQADQKFLALFKDKAGEE